MSLPSSTTTLGGTLQSVLGVAGSAKGAAANALSALQTISVDSNFVFQMLDQLRNLISQLNTWAAVSGINAFATAQIPGYAGTLTTDITATVTAATACITWVSANFPVDTGGFIQAFKLNADGSRTATTFTPSQTAPLQTLLQTFIGTIG